jgi:hypothetical protein
MKICKAYCFSNTSFGWLIAGEEVDGFPETPGNDEGTEKGCCKDGGASRSSTNTAQLTRPGAPHCVVMEEKESAGFLVLVVQRRS